MRHLAGKAVVVTGAGGSIGSELCQQIIQQDVRRLVLVSLTESGLYRIERRLLALIGSREIELVSFLGSVNDRGLMNEAVAGADVVIHAAAHKHVPICEANPIAAIENNVGGTYTLAQASLAAGVAEFVMISTDKAVRPVSVMGATKRVAELLMRKLFVGNERTRFITVRFGNVLGSDGSVVPLWQEQIRSGGPVTITDARCERFFMSIQQAVELVLGTLEMCPSAGTFVFDMGKPTRLMDLALEMIRESGTDVDLKFIGLRPGEKLTEELHFGGELRATDHPKIFSVEGPQPVIDGVALLYLLNAVRNRDRDLAVETLRAIAK
jgi:FlaA1/EpsC-like NDP-sugar epimerase